MAKLVIAFGYLVVLIIGVAFLSGAASIETITARISPQNAPAQISTTTTSLFENALGPGDIASYLGVEGWISRGQILDGEVKTSELVLENSEGATLLRYEQKMIESGHVEMISYPQRGEEGEVNIFVNGQPVQDALGSEW